MTDLRRAVLTKVESLRDYLVLATQELVRVPSINHPPTGEEFSCQMIVARHLREMGLTPQVYYLDQVRGLKDHPSYWPGRYYNDRPNVVVRREGASGGRSLVLSGHIDTVPLGTQPWRHDPFGGEIEDGRLHGLGSFDMKSGCVLILGVLRTLQELGITLKGTLIGETVVDEEFGGVNGTLAGRVRGDNGDAVIITEPSGLTVINNGNRGGRVAHITLAGPEGIIFKEGEPGHAVRQLTHLLKWVETFRQWRRARVPGWQPGPLDPVPVWVTKVSAGGWGTNVPITVPADVKVELYWQLMPGEEQAGVKGEFFDWLDEMVADKPNDFEGRPKVEFPIRFMPASEIPADAPIVQTLNRCVSDVTGGPAEVRPVPAPSDLYVVQRDFAIPTLHYGVRGGGAHAADEHVIVDDLVTATQVLTLLALDWCGRA
jgi:acetylornithine deacetylase